jgi:glycerophosphoryl diester phosphodiesterase
MEISSYPRQWKSIVTKVIGHRGLGMNRPIKDAPYLQLGENTIESFMQAQKHGAEYIEFGRHWF